jgi:flagellin
LVDLSTAGYNSSKSIVSSYTCANGAISMGTIDVDINATKLYEANDQSRRFDKARTQGATTGSIDTLDLSALTDSASDQTTLGAYNEIVDSALTDVTTAASDLGALRKLNSLQMAFVSSLMDSMI